MADKTGLQVIGLTFGGITLAVMLIASVVVRDTAGTSADPYGQPVAAAVIGQ
jgi:hypothetical protein